MHLCVGLMMELSTLEVGCLCQGSLQELDLNTAALEDPLGLEGSLLMVDNNLHMVDNHRLMVLRSRLMLHRNLRNLPMLLRNLPMVLRNLPMEVSLSLGMVDNLGDNLGMEVKEDMGSLVSQIQAMDLDS